MPVTTTAKLWQPSPERIARAPAHRVRGPARSGARCRLSRLRCAVALVGRQQGRLLDARSGTTRAIVGEAGTRGAGRRRPDAGRALLPGRAAQLRREPAAPSQRGGGRRRRAGLPRRGQGRRRGPATPSCWPRCRALAAGARALGRGRRRPRGRVPAEHARGGRRDAGRRQRSARSGRRARRTSASQGVLDRFGQIEPKRAVRRRRLLLRRQGASDPRQACAAIVAALPSRRARRRRALPAGSAARPRPRGGARRDSLGGVHRAASRREPLAFARLPFDHPLYILYSSGTTGVPKCIVHGAGGTLLQHLKEHLLHTDLQPGDRLFYFTTCGWMMWNWLCRGARHRRDAAALRRLAVPSRRQRRCGDFADAERHDHLRHLAPSTSTRCEKAGLAPRETHDLARAAHDALHRLARWRRRASTTSTATSSRTCCLASISGGTDIVSCFALGNPTAAGVARRDPVPRPGHGGRGVRRRRAGRCAASKGELVCTAPFPSMPVGFWNDPDGAQVPRRLLRALPRRLVPRRLRRAAPRTAA